MIALSGYAPDETRTRKAGFDAHVLKPVNTKQLEELVAKHEGVMSSPRRR